MSAKGARGVPKNARIEFLKRGVAYRQATSISVKTLGCTE